MSTSARHDISQRDLHRSTTPSTMPKTVCARRLAENSSTRKSRLADADMNAWHDALRSGGQSLTRFRHIVPVRRRSVEVVDPPGFVDDDGDEPTYHE